MITFDILYSVKIILMCKIKFLKVFKFSYCNIYIYIQYASYILNLKQR